jgi:hypothetical protein
MQTLAAMPTDATFESFEKELNRLVESFGNRLAELKGPDYNEAKLRDDFLNPFFRALGWDLENRAGLIQKKREVEIESLTHIGGGRKRADYLFRVDGRDRFVCEAKKPAEELHARYAFQAKRYAWNKNLFVALLTDFEEIKIYIVGGKPHLDEPHIGEWKHWNFRQYPLVARELWNLLARDQVAAGSIDAAIDSLPKKATGTGKARQQWLIKPDRTRALDSEFLEFLDETRKELASDLYKNNDHAEILADNKLTEACQRIIDRILFLRICEDRDIDTGTTLQSIVETWRKNTGNDDTGRRAHQQPLEMHDAPPPADFGASGIRAPKDSLWRAIVRHFRALDRRPPSHVPFFNGNLFKPHFTETLVIGDEWLAGFIGELSDDESPYLFDVIEVEILGSVYERFLGNVVRPHGKGITVEPKPEVRKAGGVYYTPRYIVDYIVEQTAGKLLDEIAAEKETEGVKAFATRTEKLRLLDPACGSGSFLIRAFERVCEHWQKRLTTDLRVAVGLSDAPSSRPSPPVGEKESAPRSLAPIGGEGQGEGAIRAARAAWQKKHRPLCWVNPETSDVHLTVHLKRQILTQNIYGVDLDAAAVEVTQLSLYLKMLEDENRTTLERERELFADEIALLPPLQDNIKCGNSLIASDFSMMPEDLVRVHAFDWPVQFQSIMKAGGFDAVIGNPPYILLQDDFRDDDQLKYFRENYRGASYKLDTYHLFIEQGIKLCKKGGRQSFITPSNFLTNNHLDCLRKVILEKTQPVEIVVIDGGVFDGASVDTAVFVFLPGESATKSFLLTRAIAEQTNFKPTGQDQVHPKRVLTDKAALFTSGIVNPASELWDKISGKFAKLETIADVNFGKQLRDRNKFTKDVIEVTSRNAIPKTHVACVTGKDIGRYLLKWSNLACLNDTVAQSGGCWDEAKHKAKGKLLTRQIGQYPSFALDAVGYHCLNTIFMVTLLETASINPSFLLGVLNSKLVRALWVGRFYDQRQTFPKIKGTYLKELPVALPDLKKPADKARHDKLVVLVDKILGLMPKLRAATADAEKATLQNAVTATDQQIDQLVYELYELTPEEIALVEGA